MSPSDTENENEIENESGNGEHITTEATPIQEEESGRPSENCTYSESQVSHLRRRVSELTAILAEAKAGESEERDLALENYQLRWKLQMQEDRFLGMKQISKGQMPEFLEQTSQTERYFCYCGGKVFESLRNELKSQVLEEFRSTKNPEKLEHLFSTNEGLELNRKFFKLRTQIIARKIQCLSQLRAGKYQPSESLEAGRSGSDSAQKKIEEELKVMMNQSGGGGAKSGLIGKRRHEDFEGDQSEVVQSLREDLEKMIQVSANRKVDRTVMQTQLLRSEVFRKMMLEMKRVVDYAKQLENKVDRLGKTLLEVDWLRKKELDQVQFKELESRLWFGYSWKIL